MKSKFLLIALLMPFVALQAQTSDSTKVITNSQMIGIGGTNVLDTYLSAEHFTGIGISYLSHTERQKTGKLWSTILEHEANLSSVKDVRTRSMSWRVRTTCIGESCTNCYRSTNGWACRWVEW